MEGISVAGEEEIIIAILSPRISDVPLNPKPKTHEASCMVLVYCSFPVVVWVAFKELKLSYYIGETLLVLYIYIYLYTHYGSLNPKP